METEQPLLLRFLSRHRGIGFVLARNNGEEVCCYHADSRVCGSVAQPPDPAKLSFLQPYGNPARLWESLCRFALHEACGDLILFGAYDGKEIVCFDDQVGGHGSVGGEQSRPFLILPENHPLAEKEELAGNEFLYHQVFLPLRNAATL